jgi:hypothetical protein
VSEQQLEAEATTLPPRRDRRAEDREAVRAIAVALGFVPSGTRLRRDHRALYTRMSKRQPGVRSVLREVQRVTGLLGEPHGNRRTT